MKIGCPIVKLKQQGAPAKTGKSGPLDKLINEMYETRHTKSQTYDKSRSQFNEYGYPQGCQSADDVIKKMESNYHNAKLNEAIKKFGFSGIFNRPKVRKDAVIGFTGIIKPPAKEFMQLPETERNRFLKDALECYREVCKTRNIEIDGWAVHRDEEGDHIHILAHSKNYDVHDFSDLPFKGALNRDFPAKMRARGWTNVEDCRKTKGESEEEHGRDVNTYRRDKVKEETEALEARRSDLEDDMRNIQAKASKTLTEANTRAESLLEDAEQEKRLAKEQNDRLTEQLAKVAELKKKYEEDIKLIEYWVEQMSYDKVLHDKRQRTVAQELAKQQTRHREIQDEINNRFGSEDTQYRNEDSFER